MKGLSGSADLRRQLHAVESLMQVEDIFARYLAHATEFRGHDDVGDASDVSDVSDLATGVAA